MGIHANEGGASMNISEPQSERNKVELTRVRVSNLFTQCLKDIEKTALSSGLTMRDLGVDVEKYSTTGDSCIVEFRMKI